MSKYKSVLFLILVLSAVATAIGGMAIGVLYQTALDEERLRLRVTAQSQARLIEVMARFDQAHAGDLPEGPEAATLSKIKEAHDRYEGFGDTGEFTLARREGSQIVFVLSRRHDKLGQSRPVPINSPFAEPMRRALAGQSGTLIGLDYRGEPVLAAYEPVSVISLGIVAKIDMAEVRAPFIKAGVFIASISFLLIGLGSAIFFRINDPMIKRLKESEDRFRDFAESASDWYWEMGPDLRFTYVSARIYDIVGIDPKSIVGTLRGEFMSDEDKRDLMAAHLDDIKNHRPFRDFRYKIQSVDGSTPTVSLNGKPIFDSGNGEFLGYRGTGSDVTVQVEAEQRVAKIQGQLVDALESITDGIALYDAQSCFVMCNDSFRSKLVEIEDLLVPGTPRETIARAIAEHGIVGGIEDIDDFVRNQVLGIDEPRIRQFKDGSWGIVRNYKTRDGGWFLVRTDITELKRAEQAVIQSEERIRDFAEAASDWFWEMGPDLRFTFFSDRIRDILGVDPNFYIGKTRNEQALIKEDPELWEQHFDDLKNHRPFRDFQYTIRRENKNTQVIRVNGKPVFDDEGNFLGYRGTGSNVTEQVEMERQARTTEQQLVDAIESIPQGVALFDADDLFVRCNINYRESLPEIGHLLVPGTPFGDIIRTLAEHGTIAGTKDDPEPFIRERMGDHRKLRGTRQHQRTDGTWIMVQEFRTWDGGTFLIRTDITDIKRAEQAVFQSEARFKDIAESASDWFWETGPDLRFVYVSDRYYKVTGRKPQDILGKTREETVDEEAMAADPERWRKHQEDIKARRPFNGFVMSSPGGKGSKYEGSRYHLRISGKPRFDEQGKFLGYIGAATDITDTVRHEQELRLAKESAENANRSKSEFLANMSHELRTPLNAIIGFSGTIKEEIFGTIGNKKYAEYITDIHDSGAHLLELINDILDVSVIEAGKLELDERDMDLAEIAKASYRLVKTRAEKGRVRVVNQMIGRLPHLFGDERRVKQILLNLLTNAIKFTPENGTVTMAVSLDDDGSLLVAVSDTGVGMDEDDIDKALSPFGQADSSVARKEEGTGLGLPLTKGLMEAHGGTLEIKSTPGEGTTATVRFPAKRVIMEQPREFSK